MTPFASAFASAFARSNPAHGTVYPDPSDVRLGVAYGPTGTEYTGTMTDGSGPSASDIAAAVVAALNATTIPVDTRKMNGADIIGDGTEGNDWRGVGVLPRII